MESQIFISSRPFPAKPESKPAHFTRGVWQTWALDTVARSASLIVLNLFLAAPAFGQFTNSQLKSFCFADQLGAQPYARLVQTSEGALYGTTYSGGGTVRGTVFSVNKDGSAFRALRAFTGAKEDGADPYGGLVVGSDSALYGTTASGGSANQGIVFKMNKDGSGFTILQSFTGVGGDGAQPFAGLIEGKDGGLYGTTQFGGGTNQGIAFRLNKDGSGYTVLHRFTGGEGDGSQPTAELIEGSDDAFYGTTYFGGTKNQGTIFTLNKAGSFRLLHSFSGTGGVYPYAGLKEGPDGVLYGTTSFGGSADLGTVFKLNKDGDSFRVIHNFSGTGGKGAQPFAGLVYGSDGALYGTTAFGGDNDQGVVFKVTRNGGSYDVVRSFTGSGGDGAVLYAGLIEDSQGALYGTTWGGGSTTEGTLFKLDKDGTGYSVLHNFTAGGDGATPYAPLIEGSNGALYGTTWDGGGASQGIVFVMGKEGSGYGVLHSFTGIDGDGANPHGGLIESSDGALYGTTAAGGSKGRGTIFKLRKDGSGYIVLRSFTGADGDGAFAFAGLLEDNNAVLFGATVYGGSTNQGTIFKLNKDGSGYAVLRSFTGRGGDGAYPYASLTQASDGALYGTTAGGGTTNLGTVFRLNKDGSNYRVLRSFMGTEGDGSDSYAGLIEGKDGDLYGITKNGGITNQGIVFKLNKDGSGYTVLYRFTGSGGDASRPAAGARLTEASDAALYGTTHFGGGANQGAVFRLQKDGSSYSVIHSFSGAGGDGANPYPGVIEGSNGALFGVTPNGGIGCGTLFRIAPAASLSITQNGDLTLTGPSGFRFTVQSLDAADSQGRWQVLTNLTLSSEPARFSDPAFGSGQRRYYRAQLAP